MPLVEDNGEVCDNAILFFKVSPDDIYVKIRAEHTNKIFDVFSERGRTLTKASKEEWTNNIDYGDSYELDTIEEVDMFIRNNNKYLKIIANET